MSRGKVTEALVSRIRRQLDDHGFVLWLDPEKTYTGVPSMLGEDGVPVEVWHDGVFELRHRIEAALAAWEAPRLLVYVPLGEAQVGGSLAELVAAAVVVRPGQQPPARNTRLAVVARAALADVLPPGSLESVLRQVDSGHLTLADLDRIAEGGGGAAGGALSLVFGTPNPLEIALKFLGNAQHDGPLVEKNGVAELASLLAVEYGLPAGAAPSPEDLRNRLARYLLGAELVLVLDRQLPKTLIELPRPGRPQIGQKLLDLVRTWRNRRDLQAGYVERAAVVERDLAFAALDLPLDALARVEGFRAVEERLQAAVEEALTASPTPGLVELAEGRLNGFWASVVPEVMDRWALIAAIGRVLVQADRVQAEAKAARADVKELAAQYTGVSLESPAPWALLDTYQRQMERRYHHFELDVRGAHRALEKLVARARQRYSAAAGLVAERFVKALHEAGFRIEGWPRQLETFRRHVEPALAAGKTAYVLVDGLRYEMARELHGGVDRDHDAELACTLGMLPSITEVGMAALLPRAHEGAELVAAGGGKLGLRIGGTLVRNRKERLDRLAATVGVPTFATRLEALLPPSRKVREAIESADLIVVTATDELDGLCENGNVPMARRLMDDVLLQIRRGLRVLFDLGVKAAVVTSDHGFLFGDPLDEGDRIDPPGGQTADLHRRVWVGKGGGASPSYLRVKVGDTGLGGDLELALPWSLGGFKAPGPSRAYLHGGASPQELIVPVWTVRRLRSAAAPAGSVAWTLMPGSPSISTRFLSVQIAGRVSGLFDVELPRLRVEVREGKAVVSRPVASSYGFEEATGSVQMAFAEEAGSLRPNTVTLMLEQVPRAKTVDLVLVDAGTDRVLATAAGVPVTIAAF